MNSPQEPQPEEDTRPLPLHCPQECPNRVAQQMGKGYSYLFALIMTGFMAWQSIDYKGNSKNYWELALKPTPIHVFLPGMFMIGVALKVDTDKFAQAFGILLSGKKGEG